MSHDKKEYRPHPGWYPNLVRNKQETEQFIADDFPSPVSYEVEEGAVLPIHLVRSPRRVQN